MQRTSWIGAGIVIALQLGCGDERGALAHGTLENPASQRRDARSAASASGDGPIALIELDGGVGWPPIEPSEDPTEARPSQPEQPAPTPDASMPSAAVQEPAAPDASTPDEEPPPEPDNSGPGNANGNGNEGSDDDDESDEGGGLLGLDLCNLLEGLLCGPGFECVNGRCEPSAS